MKSFIRIFHDFCVWACTARSEAHALCHNADGWVFSLRRRFGQIWGFSRKTPKMVKNGQKWSKMAKRGGSKKGSKNAVFRGTCPCSPFNFSRMTNFDMSLIRGVPKRGSPDPIFWPPFWGQFLTPFSDPPPHFLDPPHFVITPRPSRSLFQWSQDVLRSEKTHPARIMEIMAKRTSPSSLRQAAK